MKARLRRRTSFGRSHRARRYDGEDLVDLRVKVGSVALGNPIMTASGTAGHSAELGAFFDLSRIGAVVVKSLAFEPWPGNPAPRLVPVAGGLLNSVGLQGPGVKAWIDEGLPQLIEARAVVVASIWGRSVEEYSKAAAMLHGAPSQVAAVEVNVSCPNLKDSKRMFSHSPASTSEVVRAVASESGLPCWVKLSPVTSELCEVAAAAVAAGAEAVTLVNTLPGDAVDFETRSSSLGGGGGGLSGLAVHPVAVRAVRECRAAVGDVGIVGVGGVFSGRDALELMLAGASAVQVGTATFLDPRAPVHVLYELETLCLRAGVRSLAELLGRC
ncbi:MAG: dihydroorotate dehydrogenase [Acidimicrobiales bacterium]